MGTDANVRVLPSLILTEMSVRNVKMTLKLVEIELIGAGQGLHRKHADILMAGHGHVLQLLADPQMSPVPALPLATTCNDTNSAIASETVLHAQCIAQGANQDEGVK